MPATSPTVYRYDGTFDGFLSVVFAAYDEKADVVAVTARESVQTAFEQTERVIATDEARARRVEAGMRRAFGGLAVHHIETGFWSGAADKDLILYRYIRAGFSLGRRVYDSLTHPDVLALTYLCRNISREEQRVRGFVRFSEMENGVFYASLAPRNSLVPLMMPHFADRFNIQPFLLHDTTHELAGVYDGRGWYLAEAGGVTPPDVSQREHEYRRMWRLFYDAITIQGRLNPRLRRGMMPKHYWKNLPEFDPRYDPEQVRIRKEREASEAARPDMPVSFPPRGLTG